MKIIEREEILRRLTPAWCIGLMRDCLSQLEEGRAVQYLRTVTPLPSGDIMGYMPAAVSGAFGAKVITVFHHNSEKGLPSHQGSVLLFDGETGTLQAMLDGGAITEIRTGAASAVATDLLARPDAEVLAQIGSGAQARSHLLAIREIRKLREVRVWSPSLESDTRFAREMGELTGRLFAVAENYPELRSAQVFAELQQGVHDAEEHLQAARRLYNANVSNYNAAIAVFPDKLLARGRSPREFFEAEDTRREDVKMQF